MALKTRTTRRDRIRIVNLKKLLIHKILTPMKVLIFFGKGKKSDWRYQSFLGVRQSSYILSCLPSCGGILPPVEAELDFRLISLIHAPAMCNLHFGKIYIFCCNLTISLFWWLYFWCLFQLISPIWALVKEDLLIVILQFCPMLCLL